MFKIIFKTLLIFSLAACTVTPRITLTPLEIQNIQTREFENSKEIVFPSVMSVFQDLGYTVKSADINTGFISAESAAKSNSSSRLLGMSTVLQTAATAFIEKIGKITRVRLNFVTTSKRSYEYGQTDREDTPILDANIYQNAFERIENAIFVRSAD
jgi:hypothetical protein